MGTHNILSLLEEGLLVTVNSDDPITLAVFLNDNFIALSHSLDMNKEHVKALAMNSFKASFLPQSKKQEYCNQISAML